MPTIKQYDEVKLKSGKYAVIVEVLEENHAFIADVEIEKYDYDTTTIFYNEIAAVVAKFEVPLPLAN